MGTVTSGAWPPPPWADMPDQPSAGRPYHTTLPPQTPVDDEAVTTHEAQASAEGIVIDPDGADYIEFYGEKFRLADRVGLMPLVKFGHAANKGLDSDDMEGLSAMYSMIRSVIHRPPVYDEHGARKVDENGKTLRDEGEWQRFQALAEDELAEGEDIMAFVNRAMEVMAARPRRPREISSGGSRPTSVNSKADSSSPARPPEVDGLTPVADLGR
jgi:hypothetical protein